MWQTLQKRAHKLRISDSPQVNLVWGFFLYTLVGSLLLSIVFFHKTDIAFLDNVFIAASAISTTGLTTITVIDSYNFMGQCVILILIQIGAFGYMTLTTYYLFITTNRVTRWHVEAVETDSNTPQKIRTKDFVRSAVLFTFSMETLGAICFFIAFTNSGMPNGQAVWYSIFHSVSAFCTAGFVLFADSFIGYQDHLFINVILCVLSISGALGFIVVTDVWYRITKRSKEFSFTTEIIVYGFLILLTLGTIFFYISEPSIQATDNKLLLSFFQTMTAMTTVGFYTVPIGDLSIPISLMVIFLMYVGASPSGTGGGMKITTLASMVAVLKSRLFGQKEVSFFKNKIPDKRLYIATATFTLYTSLIFIFTFAMCFTEKTSLNVVMFEVSSALGTVGLSTGLTSDLTVAGKCMIILLMLAGRIGVLNFGLAILEQDEDEKEESSEEEDLVV